MKIISGEKKYNKNNKIINFFKLHNTHEHIYHTHIPQENTHIALGIIFKCFSDFEKKI